MVAPYSYHCVDKSILLPYYKKYFVSPVFRLVPRRLTANFITLISTAFVFLMLLAALWMEAPASPLLALISAFCLSAYLLGDHLDGMQAKQTGTGSPLGEFLDHHLDVYNGAIVFFTLVVFLDIVANPAVLFLMVLNCFAFAATMVEELECRKLVFGYLGTLEGVLFLIAFYLTWLIPEVRAFWRQETLFGYPAVWVIIVGLGLGYLGTILDICLRMGKIPKPFAIYGLVTIAAALLLSRTPIAALWACAILILFTGDYIARVMKAYFFQQPHPFPDPVSSAVFAALLLTSLAGCTSEAQWISVLRSLTGWLVARAVYAFAATVFRLREYWNWTNP